MVRHINPFKVHQVAAWKELLKTKVIELQVSSSNFQSLPRKKKLSYFYGLGGKFNLVLVCVLCLNFYNIPRAQLLLLQTVFHSLDSTYLTK